MVFAYMTYEQYLQGIGDILKRSMRLQDIKSAELAEKAGYSTGKVSNVRNGKDGKVSDLFNILQSANIDPHIAMSSALSPSEQRLLIAARKLPPESVDSLADFLTLLSETKKP